MLSLDRVLEAFPTLETPLPSPSRNAIGADGAQQRYSVALRASLVGGRRNDLAPLFSVAACCWPDRRAVEHLNVTIVVASGTRLKGVFG